MNASPLRFPPDPKRLRALRTELREQATQLGAGPSVCDALALVADELVNNAIEHGVGYRLRGADLSLQLSYEARSLTVEFVDPEMPESAVRELADALERAGSGLPALESERGRGLFLVAVYLSELRVAVAPGGGLHLLGRLSAS